MGKATEKSQTEDGELPPQKMKTVWSNPLCRPGAGLEDLSVPTEARSLSEAIRLALRVLGDVEAPARRVKEKVLKMFPAFREQVVGRGEELGGLHS